MHESTMASPEPATLQRVRKLLALANSPNPHEAAAAAARAQALIETHRLEGWMAAQSEVEKDGDPIEDARDCPLETAKRLRKWKVALASALAQANGCTAYTLEEAEVSSIVLVGRARDRQAVDALCEWLFKSIEWLSATHGEGQSRKWHDAFRIGVVSAVGDRLREANVEARESLDSQALVRVDPLRAAHARALDSFVSERLKLVPGRAIRVQTDAWERGRAASDTLDLPSE
jgi:hypothetical protein